MKPKSRNPRSTTKDTVFPTTDVLKKSVRTKKRPDQSEYSKRKEIRPSQSEDRPNLLNKIKVNKRKRVHEHVIQHNNHFFFFFNFTSKKEEEEKLRKFVWVFIFKKNWEAVDPFSQCEMKNICYCTNTNCKTRLQHAEQNHRQTERSVTKSILRRFSIQTQQKKNRKERNQAQ